MYRRLEPPPPHSVGAYVINGRPLTRNRYSTFYHHAVCGMTYNLVGVWFGGVWFREILMGMGEGFDPFFCLRGSWLWQWGRNAIYTWKNKQQQKYVIVPKVRIGYMSELLSISSLRSIRTSVAWPLQGVDFSAMEKDVNIKLKKESRPIRKQANM